LRFEAQHIFCMAMLKHIAVLASIMQGAMGSLCGPQIKQVVDAHNAFRASLGAADMQLMSWNQTLADQAQQQLGRKCDPEPEPGENHWIRQLHFLESVGCSLDVFKAKLGCKGSCNENVQIHNAIGCGVAECQFQGKKSFTLLCKYDWFLPQGNLEKLSLLATASKTPPYTLGEKCSHCATSYKTCSVSPPGLCSSTRGPYDGVNMTEVENLEGAAAAAGVFLILICLCCCGCAGCVACVVVAKTVTKPAAGDHKLLQSDQETGDELKGMAA